MFGIKLLSLSAFAHIVIVLPIGVDHHEKLWIGGQCGNGFRDSATVNPILHGVFDQRILHGWEEQITP